MDNVDDIGDLMIEDDSMVNQLGVFNNQDLRRKGVIDPFDETG